MMRGLLCIAVLVSQGDVIFTKDVHVRGGAELDIMIATPAELVEIEFVESKAPAPVDVAALVRSTMHERVAAVGATCQEDLKTLCSMDVAKCPGMQQGMEMLVYGCILCGLAWNPS